MNLTDMVKLGAHGYKPSEIKKFDSAGIKTDELIELAKNGYSASDVDELIKSASEPEPQPNEGSMVEPEPQPENKGDANEDKLKEMDSKLKEAEDTIKKLQEANATKNLGTPNEKKAEDEFKDALKSLY